MSCVHCEAATVRLHGTFATGCPGCIARAIGRGPDFARVRAAGRLDSNYTAALQAAGVTHEQVKAAVAADKAHKA